MIHVILQAAFVPSSDGAYDTSYFTSRYSWNHSDDHVNAACEFEDNSDDGTASGSSGYLSDKQEELVTIIGLFTFVIIFC